MYAVLKSIAAEAGTFFSETRKSLVNVGTQVSQEKELPELVDASYALRELSTMFDELKKACNKLKYDVDAKACVLGTLEEVTTVRTDYCTASLDADVIYPVPKKSSNETMYNKLMNELEVPEHLQQDEVVRIHWPGWVAYLNRLAEEGKPLPKSVDLSEGKSVPKVTCRRVKKLS